jgi:hypothetical protein
VFVFVFLDDFWIKAAGSLLPTIDSGGYPPKTWFLPWGAKC